MRKNKLMVLAGLAATTFSAVAVVLSGGMPNMLQLLGAGSGPVISSSITFSGSATSLGNRLYSVSGYTSGGKELYLISSSWDAPSEGSVMSYRDGASNATTFYISEVSTGVDGYGKPSYFGMQRVTGIDIGLSASAYLKYWESYNPSDFGDYVDIASINQTSHNVSFLRNGHFMKFNLYGQLYGGNVTSVTVQYTCSKEGKLLDGLELAGEAKKQFFVGDEFKTGSLVVNAVYSNGQRIDVTSKCSFTGYDMSQAGNQTVTVTYLDETISYTIRVIEQGGSTEPFIGKFVFSYRELTLNANNTGTYFYNNYTGHFTWTAVGNVITVKADDIEEFNHDNFSSAGYGAYNLFDYTNGIATNTLTYDETANTISCQLFRGSSTPLTKTFTAAE